MFRKEEVGVLPALINYTGKREKTSKTKEKKKRGGGQGKSGIQGGGRKLM